MNNKEPDRLATTDSEIINVSMYKLKKKYYNPESDKIDKTKVRADIDKLNIDIASIRKNGLYTYNPKTGKYIKVFDELKQDYLKILTVKLKGLESLLSLVSFNDINIPDSFKKNKNKEAEE